MQNLNDSMRCRRRNFEVYEEYNTIMLCTKWIYESILCVADQQFEGYNIDIILFQPAAGWKFWQFGTSKSHFYIGKSSQNDPNFEKISRLRRSNPNIISGGFSGLIL